MENKWGGRGGSGAERCSCAITPTRTAGAPGCCARHLWSTAGLAGSPASPTGLRAGLSEQWAGALRRPPLRQLSFAPGFARVCLTGKWSMQRGAGGGGSRVRGASSCGRSEPAVKTVPRPAPLGPQLAPALTAPLPRRSWLLGGKRDRGTGR